MSYLVYQFYTIIHFFTNFQHNLWQRMKYGDFVRCSWVSCIFVLLFSKFRLQIDPQPIRVT